MALSKLGAHLGESKALVFRALRSDLIIVPLRREKQTWTSQTVQTYRDVGYYYLAIGPRMQTLRSPVLRCQSYHISKAASLSVQNMALHVSPTAR